MRFSEFGFTGGAPAGVPLAVALAAAFLFLAVGPQSVHAQNARVAQILSRFDINGNGVPDSDENSGDDSDGDGLPDSWEIGGTDANDTDVPFPAPEAIVPGITPTPLYNRRPIRTNAASADSDGDGLSDFIELFGLMFIDDNGNGVLDADEWADLNNDGMPSIGEFPLPQRLSGVPETAAFFDFDGFVFTDPTNGDTDGDGIPDGRDSNPLLNPATFGRAFFGTVQNVEEDFDNDGLGDGMDFGNDIQEIIDNPSDLGRVLRLFRPDLLDRTPQTVSEALIEDLLAVDWNGDGLFRQIDLKRPHFGVLSTPIGFAGSINLFSVADPGGAGTISLGVATTAFPTSHARRTYYTAALRGEGGTNLPLPYQELLQPTSRRDNDFLPDPRIWTVLYSWRMPGFDIDGNGFIGIDGLSFGGIIFLNDQVVAINATSASEVTVPSSEFPFTNFIEPVLDGAIDVACGSGVCFGAGLGLIGLTFAGLVRARPRR